MNTLERITKEEEMAAANCYVFLRMPRDRQDVILSEVCDIVNRVFYEAAIKAYKEGIDTEDARFMEFYTEVRSKYPNVKALAYHVKNKREPNLPKQKDVYGDQ